MEKGSKEREEEEEGEIDGIRLSAPRTLSALKMTLTLFPLRCPEHAPQFAFRRLSLLSLSVPLPVYVIPV